MSFPWSEKDLKATPVGNDEVMLIDSEDTDPETINKRALVSSLPSAGQTNTTSNQGGGTELALPKDGVDLPFRTLFGETDKIELTQNVEDVTFTLGSLVVTTDQANTYSAGAKQSFVANAFAGINLNAEIPDTLVVGDIYRTAEEMHFIGTSATDRTLVDLILSQTLENKTLIEPIISTIDNGGILTLPSGPETLVGLDTTDILTNKTLITPIISDIENSGNLSLPTGADTLVGRVSIDTLTNKTLTAPIISTIENSGTVTLPTGPVTLVGRDTTDTFTNKTFDANAIGNSLSNVDVSDLANGIDGELITWDSAGAPTTVSTGLVDQVLTSNGAGLPPEFKDTTTGTLSIVRLEGSDISTNRLALNFLDTTNQIDFLVSDDAGNSEAEISATISISYVGQASITTLGTISTGTWEGSTITVPFGGTGVSTFTDNGVLFGNGTGAIGATSVGTAGQVLRSNGAGLAPTFQDISTVALTDSFIFVGDATNLAAAVPITGDIAIDNTGLVSITSDVIVNADVNSSAAIDFSKLATLATGEIIVGNGGVPTAATMSGNASIDNTGAVTVLTGIVSKANCRVASTANIDLSVAADPSPVDGVTLANGNRILLKNQTSPSENGIYNTVTAIDPTTWIRTADADVSSEVFNGIFTDISEGTIGINSRWILVTPNSIILDTTSLTFEEFSPATIPLLTSQGGTGAISFTEGGVLIAGASSIVDSGVLADGAILIGDGVTAPVSNVLSGDVTMINTGAVTAQSAIITAKTLEATPVADDQLLMSDTSDSANLKRIAISTLPAMGIFVSSYETDAGGDDEYFVVSGGQVIGDSVFLEQATPVPDDVTLGRLTVHANVAPSANTTFALAIADNVLGNSAAIILSGQTGSFTDTSNTDNLASGLLIAYRIDGLSNGVSLTGASSVVRGQ